MGIDWGTVMDQYVEGGDPYKHLSQQEREIRERISMILYRVDAIDKGEGVGLEKFESTSAGIFGKAFERDIFQVFKYLKPKPGGKFVDLGSGDGRWVFSAAACGQKAEGYEKDKKMFNVAQKINKALEKEGELSSDEVANVVFHNQDLLNADITDADIIVYYCGSGGRVKERLNEAVEKKIVRDAKPGAIVVLYGGEVFNGFKQFQPVQISKLLWATQTKLLTVPDKKSI